MRSLLLFAAMLLLVSQTHAQDNKFASERVVEPFTKALKDRRPAVRQKAVEELAKLGPDAELAIPDLLDALRDPNEGVRRSVANALPKLGAKVVPGLVAALKDKSADVRFLAAMALADLVPVAKDATPSLIQTLRLSKDLRVPLVVALGKMGKSAVPELNFLLKDNEPARRYDALWALANIGPDARNALPGILKALEDKDEDVRAKAVYALFRVYPESVVGLPIVGPLGVGE